LPGLTAAGTTPPAGSAATILVIGDSLSAEYGLERNSGWVALLGERLKGKKAGYQIHNSSISGDTTSGGLSRLPAALQSYRPDLVIIELGSNDALRGLPLEMTKENISEMVSLSLASRARVLLVGMQIPPNYGRHYAEQFKQLFSDVATHHEVGLVPFLFEGIATDHAMFQPDGMHPNERAQPLLAETVWQHLQPMLQMLPR
jgi:acyl-CoA thioesterase-1